MVKWSIMVANFIVVNGFAFCCAGDYQCRAKNMYGAALSRIAQLRMAQNGVTGKEVSEKIVNVGQELTVCNRDVHAH